MGDHSIRSPLTSALLHRDRLHRKGEREMERKENQTESAFRKFDFYISEFCLLNVQYLVPPEYLA